jgi:hypothetical protein
MYDLGYDEKFREVETDEIDSEVLGILAGFEAELGEEF